MADFALFKLSKPTNLDIKDAACLHIVHILQHPTSDPPTKSSQSTMVNAPKKALFASSGGQSRQINKVVHTMISSTE